MGEIEKIVNKYGNRGMEYLLPQLAGDYLREAAEYILSWQQGTVFIATGFYVKGYAETDGPLGTYALARTLQLCGYRPVILTDEFCKDFFEKYGFEVIYADIQAAEEEFDKWAESLLKNYKPSGMISVERCGINVNEDYANMRGVSIRAYTAPIDRLFAGAVTELPTVGIGDGGNEIGMGNLKSVIEDRLDICPCRVLVDKLIIATVSNWGAYALAALIGKIKMNAVGFNAGEIYDFLKYIVSIGAVDGVSGENKEGVDGFPWETEAEIINAILNNCMAGF